MKLISRANLKTYLSIAATTYDDLLDLIISQTSARLQKYLNRKLKKQEYTEYFNIPISRKTFNLRAYPIDLTEDFTVTQYDVEDTINVDYFVYEDKGIVQYYTERTRCSEPKCMKFVYTGGYEELYTDSEYVLDVPDDIQRAAMIQSAYDFKRRKDIGLTTTTTPDGSISKANDTLLPEVVDILKSYRNRSVGRTF